ncbi:LysR family transcriptional regulator [uncultured Leifsonia sp.]|uniref:LysR family transcriptional regulator n=1 Tax=uncultured Leifsonia sp. TaxID=340359 RepID=UPI0028D74A4A|nr:LysR family transcriptional regulator [uncultured Leifsonia sp.]
MPRAFDLRKLRYFVAVAEEGNFTRAAHSLHIAQPVLSRQIKELEQELGGSLFIRHPRRLELTAGGRKLLTDGRRLLTAAARLSEEVRSLAAGTCGLTIGHHRAVSVRRMVLAFQRAHPDAEVTVMPLDHGKEADAVISGAVDVAVVCLPAPPHGVTSTVLWEEPTMVALSTMHVLAQRPTLTLADLAPFDRARFDSTELGGGTLRDADDRLDFLANSASVHLVPSLVAERYRHPDVNFIPVTDSPPTPVVALHSANRESALSADFTAAALAAHNDMVNDN